LKLILVKKILKTRVKGLPVRPTHGEPAPGMVWKSWSRRRIVSGIVDLDSCRLFARDLLCLLASRGSDDNLAFASSIL
jgi:hypothetical protein